MGELVRGDMGAEDVKFHVPGASAARQTYARTAADGTPSQVITKVADADLTLLNDKIYSGAVKHPFDDISPLNAAKALAFLAKRSTGAISLESICRYGSVSQADAVANGVAIAAAIAEIKAAGRGAIIQPPGLLKIDPAGAGDPMVLADTMPAFEWSGVPGGSILQAYDAAKTGPLLKILNTGSVTIAGVKFDKQGVAGGECILVETTAGGHRFYGVQTNKGQIGLSIKGGGLHARRVWVDTCEFMESNSFGLYLEDVGSSYIQSNYFQSASGAGGLFGDTGGTAGRYMGDILVHKNIFGGAIAQTFQFQRSCTYDASIHQGIKAVENVLSAGDMVVLDLNRSELIGNRLYSGAFVYACSGLSGQTTASQFRAYRNESFGASGPAFIVAMAVDLTDFEIEGGVMQGAGEEGLIFVVTADKTMRNGRVRFLQVLGCSAGGSGAASGIAIVPGTAGSGMKETLFSGNIIRSTAVPKHKYGFESIAGGTSANIHIAQTMIGGYITGRALLSGVTETNAIDLGA